MAKHYSGKRAAGRKPVGKRALSLLMALVMSLSLVQITAFAVETTGTTQQNAEIGTQGETMTYEGGKVVLSKTVKKSDTGPNDFNITLEVTVKDETIQTPVSGASVVLVLDRSNSMNGNFSTVRTAAKDFARTLLEKSGNEIAVVGFGNNYDSVPAFTTKLDEANKAIEGATQLYGNNQKGGTNIQAGVYAARKAMEAAATENKIIVIFSDGAPTFSYFLEGKWTGCKKYGLLHFGGSGKLTGGYSYTNSFNVDNLAGDGRDFNCTEYARYTCDHGYTRVDATGKETNNGVPAIYEAKLAKDAGATIYGVYLGSDENAASTLKDVATSDKHFYSTGNLNGLADIFGGIVESVVATQAGAVTDPMGEHIQLGTISNITGLASTEDGLTWDVGSNLVSDENGVRVYRVTYPITLLTGEEGFEEGKEYATNGKTTFSYTINNEVKTVDFDVPTVKGTVPTYGYRVEYYLQGDAALADYKNYTKVEKDTFIGPDTKLHTTVSAPAGYAEKYDSQNYTFEKGETQITIAAGENVMKLYYKLAEVEPAKVTYTVEYYLEKESGYDKMTPDYTVNGEQETVGQITIQGLYEAGFENVPAGYELDRATLDFDGVEPGEHSFTDGQVFKLYYKLAEVEPGKVTYTVNYFLEKDYGYNKMAPDYTVNGEQETVGQITIKDLYEAGFENVPAGYELDRATLDFDGVAPGEHSFTDGQVFNLYYKLAPIPMPEYTVEYYLKDSDTDKYEVKYSETFQAEFGEVTIAALKAAWTENVPEDVKLDAYVLDEDMLAEGYDGIAPGTHDFKEDGQVFKLYYKLAEVEPEGPFTYWVKHIYMNGMLVDGVKDEYFENVEAGTKVVPAELNTYLDYTVNGVKHVYQVEKLDPDVETFITENDQVFTIYYQRNDPTPEYITVTVNYVEKDNISNVLHNSKSEQFELVGGVAAYDVTGLKFNSLTKGGTTYSYDSADAALTGKVESDLTITLYYKAESNTPVNPPVGPTVTYYSVTVNYYDKASGESIHTPYTDSKASGSSYDVTAQDKIAIEGYTYVETAGDALTGTLNGNKVINVYYSKTTDIDDDNTPTTPADPGTDIEEPDVPVSPAQPPKTGDSMGLWIAAAMVSGMGLVWISLSGKKREEEV